MASEISTGPTSGSGTVSVLIPLALPKPYDYKVPAGMTVRPGDYVVVPLGPQELLGVVWGEGTGEVGHNRLKAIVEVLDAPPMPEVSRRFVDWVAGYTLSPAGSVRRVCPLSESVTTSPTPTTSRSPPPMEASEPPPDCVTRICWPAASDYPGRASLVAWFPTEMFRVCVSALRKWSGGGWDPRKPNESPTGSPAPCSMGRTSAPRSPRSARHTTECTSCEVVRSPRGDAGSARREAAQVVSVDDRS